MIEHLRIADLGVISAADVELHPGFTVVTGETGAGKTMVVTALGLLLGRRADAGTVRHGARRAVVDAGLRLPEAHPALVLAEEAGADLDPGDDGRRDLVLNRTVSTTADGTGTRSRAAVGGRSAPVSLLGDLGAQLVTVHGQADQLRLRSAEAQRHALDSFAGAELAGQLQAYRTAYTRWRQACREHAELTAARQERARQADALQRSLEEIDAAAVQPGEDDQLRARIRRLEDHEQLRATAAGVYARLSGADPDAGPEAPGAVALVEAARQDLLSAPGEEPELAEAARRLGEAAVVLNDIAGDIARYQADLDSEAGGDLDAAQSRLAEITRLQRLYGPELTDVLAWAERERPRLAELQSDTDRVDELAVLIDTAGAEVARRAQTLRRLRRKAAARLEEQVTAELHALFMPDASFHVDLTPLPEGEYGPQGADEVALLLRPHAGVEPRPLGRGASGGELSRVMLALEVVLAATDPVPTFVFDEVDAGVGGEAAVAIGTRLARLAEHVQVICVTHLPQVAACADRHVHVRKNSDPDAGVTTSDVTVLDRGERVEELARMLAGHADSAAAREHARELLEGSGRNRM